jgi:BMFP domain-containing protein YqiC
MNDKNVKDGKLSDMLKKAVTTGISAAFMTEDGVKNLISDLPLPKDIVSGLLQNAKESKEEFVKSIKNELKAYLNKIDLTKEIDKLVEKYDFEVKATISLKKKSADESDDESN